MFSPGNNLKEKNIQGEKAMQIYFVSLEKNKEILSEIGFEFVSMCEVIHRNNIQPLEIPFK